MSTYLCLNVHAIFSTKDRAPMIDQAWQPELHAYIGGMIRKDKGIPYAVGGTSDHVHFLAGIRATPSLADLMRDVKKASSHWASERYERFAWQEGYAAFSVGYREVPVTVNYILKQEEHHKKEDSEKELLRILEEFGVPVDMRFFK